MYKIKFNHAPRFATKFKKALLLAILISVIASVPALAQETPAVQITQSKPTVGEVFKSISQQTGLNFTYDQNFDLTRRVDLPKVAVPLSQVLAIVLQSTGRSYVIANNNVLIKLPKAEQTQATPNKPQIKRVSIVTQKVEGNIFSLGSSQPLSNATILAAGDENYITTSDNSGKFTFDKLPVGEYQFTVSHSDYGDFSLEVRVAANQNEKIAFALQPKTVQVVKSAEQPTGHITQLVAMDTYLKGVDPGMRYKAPRWGIKTNLLADVTANISLGAEVRIGRKMTLDLPVSGNFWTFNDNKKWKHFLVQPELRWWGHEAFNRHFIGVNLSYAVYNVGNINLPFGIWNDLKDYRYDGHLFGGGVSVGHQWIVGKRLNLEATLGLGYFYTDYTKRDCATCGDLVEKGSKHYFGPTKFGLSLIYVIR